MASRARSSSPFAFSYNGKLPDFNREASYSYGHSSSGSKSSRRSVTPGRTRSLSLGSPTPNMKAHIGYPSPPPSYASSNSLSTGSFMLDYPSSANRTKENITVTVRFRPLSAREIQKGDEVSWCMQGDTTVRSVFNEGTAYAYDKVFGPTTNTKSVYDIAARNVVRGAMEGINGTVFAYGVTSSGKTHTMHGDQISPGIIPTAIQDVFKIIQETPGREFLLRVSYLEIYNEVINDLLDPAGQNLRVREDTQGTYVEGIKEEVVLSAAHALSLIAAGEEHRHVGSNNFNLFSSRSHTIFTLTIESSVCGGDLDDDGATLSQLNLIDLAGSESSKTETTGLRRKEGSYINKSLLTLGTVISKLSDGRAAHIPYRDSKLTRLLQSSLSGHGRISLICTITPASSNIEETNNTLKFAQRAKRVEIYAAPNRIMDEKSLIRKYQKEISILKQELEQLKRGIFGKQFPTSGHEDLFTLRQQLEAGQVQMQSRLEEEEQAKAALMGRIQRLTKLILVSTKSTIPGGFQQKLITNTAPTGSQHRRRHSLGEEERTEDMLLNPESGSSCGDPPVVNPSTNNNVDALVDVKLGQRRSFNWRGDESALFESTQAGELFSATAVGQQTSAVEVIAAEQMDLLGEQAKMLAGEIALCNSSLRRLSEQLTNSPDDPQLQAQIQKLKDEMSEKQHDMQLLEQRMMEGGAAATANASLVEMSQVISMLTTQLNEKAFELEIKAADNRILQEQLQAKIIEIKELQERNDELEKYQKDNSKDIVNGLLNANKALKDELCNLKYDLSVQASRTEELERGRRDLEEGKGILVMHNQKLTSEASYAKELASAAATELKCLAEEARKLSLQNTQLSEELQAAKQMALQAISKPISNGYASYGSESTLTSLLQLLKEKAKSLESQLEEKKKKELELQNRVDESRERETALENDVANMWVLVAKLKAHNPMNNFAKADVVDIYPTSNDSDSLKDLKATDDRSKDGQRRPNCSEEEKQEIAELRTVISQLKGEELDDLDIDALEDLQNLHVEALTKLCQAKTKIQDRIREREREQILSLQEKDQQDEERTSHVCKVCFEAPTAAVLLPCRHFCLCKRCAIACTECPLCRSTIADRIITYTS